MTHVYVKYRELGKELPFVGTAHMGKYMHKCWFCAEVVKFFVSFISYSSKVVLLIGELLV